MADLPSFIALPPRQPPRCSALKHPSRPGMLTTSPLLPGSGPTTSFASAAAGALSPSLCSPRSRPRCPAACRPRTRTRPYAPASACARTRMHLRPRPHASAPGFAARISFGMSPNPAASILSDTLRARTRAGHARVPLCELAGRERSTHLTGRSTRSRNTATSSSCSAAYLRMGSVRALGARALSAGVDARVDAVHESCRDRVRALMRLIHDMAIEYDPDRKVRAAPGRAPAPRSRQRSNVVDFITGNRPARRSL
jgi:hypothetical protein